MIEISGHTHLPRRIVRVNKADRRKIAVFRVEAKTGASGEKELSEAKQNDQEMTPSPAHD